MSISSRNITGADYSILASSLLLDEYHKDTLPDFFYEEGTVTSVFEDEQGIVLFVRGKVLNGAIVMDIQFLNNLNVKRNMRTMLEGLPIPVSVSRSVTACKSRSKVTSRLITLGSE